jgi:hypothetical protein
VACFPYSAIVRQLSLLLMSLLLSPILMALPIFAEGGNNTDPSQGNNTDPSQGNNTDPSQGNNTDPSQGNNTDPSQE